MIPMARSRKKHTAYRKVCEIIGQPAAVFADHIRQLMGENGDNGARIVTYNKSKNISHVVTVAATATGAGDRRHDEEFVLTLAENRGYVHGAGGGEGASGGQAAKPQEGAAKGRRTIFKGRVQLSPSPQPSSPRGGRGGGGGGVAPSTRRGGGGGRAPAARRQPRTIPGLSSIAGVCMLCAVAAAGGVAFHASYMSQSADHGTINVIRAEVLDLDETVNGRLLDLELFASQTSCVYIRGDRMPHVTLHEDGDACNERFGRNPPPEATSYTTSTGVHVTLEDFQMGADDREWLMIEIYTDTASIIHPVRVKGAW